jgi:hypothetical protein
VLDFLVAKEQLGVTLVSAAIENAPGTHQKRCFPSCATASLPNCLHTEALKKAGGNPLTTKYWFPDAALDNGGASHEANWASRSARRTTSASRTLTGPPQRCGGGDTTRGAQKCRISRMFSGELSRGGRI